LFDPLAKRGINLDCEDGWWFLFHVGSFDVQRIKPRLNDVQEKRWEKEK